MCLIKIENLEKTYNNKKVINSINYEFYENHVYGIVGKNGAGKSVFIKMLLGAISPSLGSVVYKEINGTKPIISCVIDGCDLHMNMSGLENLVYLAGFMKTADVKRIRECMKIVGLDPDNKVKIKKYSLGMKKRLLIAQAIMEDADIMIFDEPTNSLDTDGINMLHRIIKESKDKGKLIIIASHYKEDIENLCDTILELKDGILC